MAVKFELVKSGDVLYECGQMGTGKLYVTSTFERGCVVRREFGELEFWTRKSIERLRRKPYKSRPKREAPHAD